MQIKCPEKFDDIYVTEFLKELALLANEKELVIDFRTIKFVYPYATLLVASGIRGIVKERHSNGLDTAALGLKSKENAISYLNFFGFFQYIGLESGNTPNNNSGNSNYIPITIISEDSLSDCEGDLLQEKIDNKSLDLSKIIFEKESDDMKAYMLSYCIREIIRNVFEHAEANKCVIMGQKWRNGFAEIAIADEGIGIFNTINPVHSVDNVEEGIRLALLPGISQETAPNDVNNKWQNSGFGLYVISELGREYGDFAISSNKLILHRKNNEENIDTIPLEGTLIKLKIKTDCADYFPNILNNIVEKGEKEASLITGARKSASKQSRIIDMQRW